MRISSTAKYALGVTAAAAMLAGCSSGASSLAPTTPTMGAQGIHHQVSTLVSHVGQVVPNINHGPSWMSPDAKKSKQFLYVSDAGAGTVQVYAWPKPKTAVGTLTGFSEPQGLCADTKGDIFVANTEGLNIIEYKAGGKSPIATIPDPDGFPAGCSIDSKGNLAVSNIINASGGTPGNLDIFKGLKSPKKYTSSVLIEDFFVGFDKAGNAWVSGLNGSGSAGFTEISNKGKEVTGTISGATIAFPGSTEFDGKVMTTGDQESAVAYQLKKYKVTGNTPLSGQSDIVQYWIDQPTSLLIGPDAGNIDVEIYKYPAGGSPTQTLSGGFSQPIGATVSAKP